MKKEIYNIESVVSSGLCTGCGTCVGVCPSDALEMVIDEQKGIYVPKLDMGNCSGCNLCFDVCPGYSVDFSQLNQEIFNKEHPEDDLLGNYRNCYMGHAMDCDIRYNSASGGLVTALLVFALENGLIDGAMVTRMNKNKPFEPAPFIARTREEIISASKSKYCPVPANIVLKDIIRSEDSMRYAVVGLPCHIQGIRKAESIDKRLKEKIIYHFAILCGHSDKFHATQFILNKYDIKQNDVKEISYRGGGWPGSMTIGLSSGVDRVIPYKDYIIYHGFWFFAPSRCLVCCDSISQLADITFMDAWLPEVQAKNKLGESIIVSRSSKSENLCYLAQKEQQIEMNMISGNIAVSSQGKSRLSNTDFGVHYNVFRLLGKNIPVYNRKFPSSSIVNYLRVFLIRFNMWVASRKLLRRLVRQIAYLESKLLHSN